jgi:SanA protein
LKINQLIRLAFWSITFVFAVVLIINIYLIASEYDEIETDINQLEAVEYGIILGTSSRLISGEPNPFFFERINAASRLYKAGKVKKLILSGDNREKYYNEPGDMKKALNDLSIPDSVLILDPEGLSTILSLERAYIQTNQGQFIVITQRFHAYRTSYVARQLGLNVKLFEAKSPPFNRSMKVQGREVLARVKAFYNVIRFKLGYPVLDIE